MQEQKLKKLLKLVNMGLLCAALLPAGARADEPQPSLEEVVSQEILRARLGKEEREHRATEYIRLGEQYLKSRQYAAAAEQFTLALSLQPEAARAKAGQEEALRYLENHSGRRGQTAGQVLNISRVREEYNAVEVRQFLAQARQAFDKANQPSANLNGEQRALLVAGQLKLLDEAEQFAQRAGTRLEGMPVNDDSMGQKVEVVTLQADIRRKRAEYTNLLEEIRRGKAAADVAAEKHLVKEMEDNRHAVMLAQGKRYLEKMELDLAEDITEELLRLNPADKDAEALREEIRARRLTHREETIADLRRENREHMLRQLERAAIAEVSFSQPIRYPDNWRTMNRRKSVSQALAIVSKQKQEVLKRLEDRYSFDFPGVEFATEGGVLDTIRQRTGLNLNTASIPEEMQGTAITLSPSQMRLENILKHVLRQVNGGKEPTSEDLLIYTISDSGIINFIKAAENKKSAMVEDRVFDVRDITAAVKSARKIQHKTGDDSKDDDDEEADKKEAEESIKVDEIIAKAFPGDFSIEGENSNLKYMDGPKKLSVRGTAEQIAKAEEVLKRLREVQMIQVSISSRYLKLQDDFWEQFRSEFYDFDNYNNSSKETAHQYMNRPMSIAGNPMGINLTNSSYGHSDEVNAAFAPGKYWNEVLGSIRNGGFSGVDNVFNHGASSFSNKDTDGLSFGFQQNGLLGDLQTQWFLQMVRKNSRADELFNPHLMVFNNRYGWIRFAVHVPYTKSYGEGSGTYGMQAQLADLEDGCSLEVEPRVSTDKKYVTIQAQPRIDGIYAMNQTVFGSMEGTDPAGVYTIDLPTVMRFEAKTYATVPDGGSVLIGGLSTNINSRGRNGVPMLQDLPIVGNMFSNRYTQKSKETYTCLINAKIVLLEEEEAKHSDMN